MFKFRSVRSIVIPPASTGKDKSNRITVMKAAQTKRGIRSQDNILGRMFVTVEIKFKEPRIELTPAR